MYIVSAFLYTDLRCLFIKISAFYNENIMEGGKRKANDANNHVARNARKHILPKTTSREPREDFILAKPTSCEPREDFILPKRDRGHELWPRSRGPKLFAPPKK